MDLPLLDDVADLRHAAMSAHPGFKSGPAARASIHAFLAEGLTAVGAGDGGVSVREAGDAYVLWWSVAESWHGGSALRVAVDHRPDPAAIRWACAQLDAVPRRDDWELMLGAGYIEVRRHLLRGGVGIDSVTLTGAPTPALDRLVAAFDPPRTAPGLTIAPMAPVHVPAIVALHVELFTAAPEFCSFGTRPRYVEGLRQRLETPPPGLHEVLLRGERVLGFWGSDFELDNVMWGRSAGMELLLHPDAQGRGLVKTAYRRLLEAQVEAGIEVFKGGTAQPAVMGLGRVMGRRPLDLWMTPGAHFPASHFRLALA